MLEDGGNDLVFRAQTGEARDVGQRQRTGDEEPESNRHFIVQAVL